MRAALRTRRSRCRWIAALVAGALLAGCSASSPPSSATSPTSTSSTPTTTAAPVRQGFVTASRLIASDLGIAATLDSATSTARVFVTNDWLHWRDVTPPGMTAAVDDLFALDRSRWWVTSSSCRDGSSRETVWRTRDAGRTWASTPAGGHVCAAGSTSSVRFLTGNFGWLVDIQPTGPVADLWVTDDGGTTWTRRSSRLPELGSVVFRTPTDGFLGGPCPPHGQDCKLYVTHDGGATWADATTSVDTTAADLPSWQVRYAAPTFFDAAAGVMPVTFVKADTESVAWYSTSDGGRSWVIRAAPRSPGITEDDPANLEVAVTSVASASVWWDAARYRANWRTEVTVDAGRTWSVAESTPIWAGPHRLQAVDGQHAWLNAGNGALLATSDGGAVAAGLNPHAP